MVILDRGTHRARRLRTADIAKYIGQLGVQRPASTYPSEGAARIAKRPPSHDDVRR
jgi:hypothetical protein